MIPTTEQQIFETLGKSTKILIALPEHAHADVVGSALALMKFLKKLDKEAEVVSAGPLPAELSFLPEYQGIKSSLSNSNSLVVMLNTTVTELDQISYHQEEGHVNIYLKPKDGIYTPSDITFSTEKFPYDVVVTLGARSLEDLGVLFEQNADVFFETPKINIDNHPGNGSFGAINLVDMNATSVAEMLASLFEKYETQLIDEDIATCLLTGIIAKTHSFQHAHTTPKAFLKASELIGLGGRQQEIIKFLYKTKSLPLLRLWGRALARIKMADEFSLVYSMLNLSDYGKSGAGSEDAESVLKEMTENISGYNIVGLLSETLNSGSRMLLAINPQLNIEQFLEVFPGSHTIPQPANGSYAIVDVDMPGTVITDAEAKLLEVVQNLA